MRMNMGMIQVLVKTAEALKGMGQVVNSGFDNTHESGFYASHQRILQAHIYVRKLPAMSRSKLFTLLGQTKGIIGIM
jgi:hypothetical protein